MKKWSTIVGEVEKARLSSSIESGGTIMEGTNNGLNGKDWDIFNLNQFIVRIENEFNVQFPEDLINSLQTLEEAEATLLHFIATEKQENKTSS